MIYFIEKQRAEKARKELGEPRIEKVSPHLWIYHWPDGTSIAFDPKQTVTIVCDDKP